MVQFENLPNFSKGETISLTEMNKLLAVGVDRMNELKDKRCVIELGRRLCPHDSYSYNPATTLLQALETVRNQQAIIIELELAVKAAHALQETKFEADNDPKFAEEFVAIAIELNLRGIGIVNEYAKKNGLKEIKTTHVNQKWYERLYAWVMSK